MLEADPKFGGRPSGEGMGSDRAGKFSVKTREHNSARFLGSGCKLVV